MTVRRARQLAAVGAIVVGVGLLVTPFAASLFSRSKSAERLADGVRPAMTKQALASDRAGFTLVDTAVKELNGPDRARLAHAFGQSPQHFDSFLISRFPAVATGARELPRGFLPHSNLILTTLEKDRKKFETADNMPLSGVSPRVGPWIFIALGVAFIVAGLVIFRGRGRGALVVLLLLGLVPLVFGVAASLPHKASSTDALVDGLRPAFAQKSAGRVPAETASAQKFASQLESGLVPAIGKKLNLAPRERDAYLRGAAPAVAKVLPQLRTIVGTFATLGAALVADRHFYLETAKIPSRTLVWLMLIGCLVVLLVAAAALLAERRRAAPVSAQVG